METDSPIKTMSKKPLTKVQIVTAVAGYIMDNGPVSHSALQDRAMSFNWYTMDRFDKVIETIHRHPQISTSVKDDDVYYKKKISRPRKAPAISHLSWSKNNYPESDEMMGIHPVFEEMDKACSCVHHLSREAMLEYKERGEHHRFCNRHPDRIPIISNLYNKYYGRESDPDENNQTAPEQGGLLLETE